MTRLVVAGRIEGDAHYIKRTHILDYWRAHDFPPLCKPEGDGARCE
ncbi:MAG TPA: hypothetical protein VIE67_00970 [Rudaea sp.]|jgi:hypothetical protein